MKILFLPPISSSILQDVQNVINESIIKCSVSNIDEKHDWSGTVSYAKQHEKLLFTEQSGITIHDIDKVNLEQLGNGITTSEINGKPCSWICFSKDSDISKDVIDEILHIISQEEIKHG